MAMTMWINDLTGESLDDAGVKRGWRKAKRVYAANTHIFEDEYEALGALGIVPMCGPEAFLGGS